MMCCLRITNVYTYYIGTKLYVQDNPFYTVMFNDPEVPSTDNGLFDKSPIMSLHRMYFIYTYCKIFFFFVWRSCPGVGPKA